VVAYAIITLLICQ